MFRISRRQSCVYVYIMALWDVMGSKRSQLLANLVPTHRTNQSISARPGKYWLRTSNLVSGRRGFPRQRADSSRPITPAAFRLSRFRSSKPNYLLGGRTA